MTIKFKKYHGTGNDFVMLDNRKGEYNKISEKQVAFACSRRFGIGADGLIMLQEHEDYDFEMIYFNSDGRTSSMCGNGGRCIAQFAADLGIGEGSYTFLAIDGEHQAVVRKVEVSLKMSDTGEVAAKNDDFFIDTGSPHYLRLVEDVMNYDLLGVAKEIRYSGEYETEGVNVNLIERKNDDTLAMRTYERGVEGETYSCGTGVTAAALAAYSAGKLTANHINVITKGGELSLSFKKTEQGFSNIWLTGPATFVFQGEMKVQYA